MFIDASAMCAILLNEPDKDRFLNAIAAEHPKTTSPIAVWETVRALVREKARDVGSARRVVEALMQEAGITEVAIGRPEQGLALDAFDRFGKGRHPAALNLGDCFAYACAKAANQPLLYKGDDFARTDIEAA